ncbi:MAG: basic amino acid ABC transporter substrate-binding protein [Rhodobacteraceae bacterium]|jgi:polar amino acid transport system substrate-binding protein|nr:basic amino acid ABC transporter substrate-binding protein [Paracoccaceae bacterium]MBC65963.1 basic amino acid ABC transporter substrate-binding protein [Paracoccaceae bacterium]MDG2097941.1 transporter substrate-binding domain-containing protein [Paracoccaceae bacterium]RZO39232.1 MAG: transporter substrate-binding domain-containing protein [Paracoccaceae bacterium]|tara:strand:+ start:428 stop:1165 length:738 start_codon:yes stop_codon:yes gene_type:complete
MYKSIFALIFSIFLAGPIFAADLGGRVISIGSDTTYPPHEFIEDGVVKGFDVDVVAAICERINCVPNWVTTAWDGIFPALANGEFDMVVSGVTITEERDKIVDFSDPYIIVQQGILMRVSDKGATIDDFKSGAMKLASQNGTTNAALGEELVGRDNLALFDSFNNAVIAVQNGDVDGVIIDSTSAAAYEQEFAGELAVGITGLSSDPLGLVFQEGDSMQDDFNEGLAAIIADGTLQKLTIKWWPK